MYIPDHMILGIHESTRSLVIRRNGDGTFKDGFVMGVDDFVTNMEMIKAVRLLTEPEPHQSDGSTPSNLI